MGSREDFKVMGYLPDQRRTKTGVNRGLEAKAWTRLEERRGRSAEERKYYLQSPKVRDDFENCSDSLEMTLFSVRRSP
jgi:hypothetical protein